MNIFIEADSVTYDRMSGIGHATLQILKGFDKYIETHDDELTVTAIVPQHKKPKISRFNFDHIIIKELPFKQKYINFILTRTSIPIPVDIFLGRGAYLFPNYKTWWTPLSVSLTFIHDVAFRIFPDTIQPTNLKYLSSNFERWLRRATKLIIISKSSAIDFETIFPEFTKKVNIIHLGVDSDTYYHRSKDEVSAIRKKYNIPNNYFLFVGNIEPRKNIMKMLSAYEQYCDGEKDRAALVLVGGDGWNNELVLKKIKKLADRGYPIIRPSDYVPDEDLPALYTGARSLIHVALHEGFGLPPLQAEACGTHVIASKIAALEEILDPRNTEFVNPNSTNAISKALKLATDKVQASHAPELLYSWDRTTARIIDTIRNIT